MADRGDTRDAADGTSYGALLEDSAEDLYENAPCGYLSALPGGLLVKVNRTFLDWTGFRREDLVGRRRFQDLLTAGGRIYHETHYAPLLAMQGAVREIAVEIVCADGRRLPALVNSVLRRDDDGRPLLTRTTVFNATDRKEYERELLRARRRAERSEARVRALQQVTAELAAAAGVVEIAGVIVQAVMDAFGAAGSVGWLVDAEAEELVLVAGGWPAAAAGGRTPLNAPLPQTEAVRRRDVVVASLDEARSSYPGIVGPMEERQRVAVVAVPLLVGERVPGVVAFGREEAAELDEDELALLRTFARQAGPALERALLYEAEQRLRAQADALHRVTAALAATLDPPAIAAAVVDELLAALGAEVAQVAVLDGSGRLEPVRPARAGPAPVPGHGRRPPRPSADEPVLAEPRFLESGAAAAATPSGAVEVVVDALATVPLVVDRRPIGLLSVGFAAARRFSPEERAFLAGVAGQCAQALERARLHAATVEDGRRSAFMAEAGRALDAVQGLDERVDRLLALVVPALADWAALVRADGADGHPVVAQAEAEGADATELSWPSLPAPLHQATTRVLRSGRVVVGGGAPGPDGRGRGRSRPPTPSETAARSYAAVPLRVAGGDAAALVLVRTRVDPAFGSGDEPFLLELADLAGLALENARLYERERDVAQTLQRSLLAGAPPTDPRFEVAACYRPAVDSLEVGGDWHDAAWIDDDRLAIVVGDVVGRGIEAASAMGQLRSAVRALALSGLGPARLLERLDAFVEPLEAAQMATVAYVEVDLAAGRLRLACAGHPPPMLLGPDGELEVLWGGRSTPLGAYVGAGRREEEEHVLAPGSTLLLYTDGLIERRGRTLDVGIDRLADELRRRRREQLPELVAGLAATLLADEQTSDDVCLLAFSLAGVESFAHELPADPTCLSPLRAALRAWLVAAGLDGDGLDAVVLASSEAAANSIEHGYGLDARGRVQVTGRIEAGDVVVQVRDDGRWRPPEPRHDRGRGFLLIDRLMDEVHVEHPGGTTVTMRRRLGEGSAR